MLKTRVQRLLGPRNGIRYQTGRAVYRKAVRATRPLVGKARRGLGLEMSIRVGDHRFWVPEDMRWAFQGGTYYESGTRAALLELSGRRPDQIFYDIGANAGYFSLLLAPRTREVHSFEPVDTTFACLSRNIDANDVLNVRRHQLALGAVPHRDTMHLYSSSGNNSLHQVGLDSVTEIGRQAVEVDTVDHLVESGVCPPPTLIKIDIEGGELGCLQGAAVTLRAHRPVVVCEFFGTHFESAGYTSHDLAAFLADLEYDLYVFDSDAARFDPVPLTEDTKPDSRTTLLALPAR